MTLGRGWCLLLVGAVLAGCRASTPAPPRPRAVVHPPFHCYRENRREAPPSWGPRRLDDGRMAGFEGGLFWVESASSPRPHAAVLHEIREVLHVGHSLVLFDGGAHATALDDRTLARRGHLEGPAGSELRLEAAGGLLHRTLRRKAPEEALAEPREVSGDEALLDDTLATVDAFGPATTIERISDGGRYLELYTRLPGWERHSATVPSLDGQQRAVRELYDRTERSRRSLRAPLECLSDSGALLATERELQAVELPSYRPVARLPHAARVTVASAGCRLAVIEPSAPGNRDGLAPDPRRWLWSAQKRRFTPLPAGAEDWVACRAESPEPGAEDELTCPGGVLTATGYRPGAPH